MTAHVDVNPPRTPRPESRASHHAHDIQLARYQSRNSVEHTYEISQLNRNAVSGGPGAASITTGNDGGGPLPSVPLLHQLLGIRPFRTSYWSLYRPLKTWKEKGILALAIILALAAGVPLPLIGYIFGKIINAFPPSEDELNTRIGQLLGVAVAYFVITWGWATCWGVVGERVSRGLREALLQKAIGMDMAWFEVEAPDIANRLTADTQTIQLGTSEKVGLFLQSIAYFIAAFALGFALNARLTGILFVGVVPTMFLVVTFGSKIVSKYSRKASESSEKATSVAEGAINAVEVVQAFDALDRLADEHMEYMGPAVLNGMRKAIAGAAMLGMVYFTAYSANALAFWEGSQEIAKNLFTGTAGAGTVYTVVFLILDASFVVGQFGPFLQTFALAAAAGRKIIELLDRPEPIINVYSDEGLKMPEPVENNDLVLQDATFVYPARAAVRVVENVNLTFPAGTVTAIVGPSGSGKSTVVSMLMRFYDPASGCVRVGGHDLRELNVREYRKHVALVDQEPVLFSATVLENIKHGLLHTEGLTEEQKTELCMQAAKDANAYDFIMSLPQGFDTRLGSSGTQLSGGQKQRVSLARALVSNPSILLLDEPTSALDTNSEAAVLQALEKAKSKKGRTTIMIAHRLATVQGADKIVVMADGHVVEEGTHESLMANPDGAYQSLVRAQKLETATNSGRSSFSSARTQIEEGNQHVSVVGQNPDKDEVTAAAAADGKRIEFSAAALVGRALSLSKPDAPIIALGLAASIITGGIIIGEAIVFGNLISILNEQKGDDSLASRAAFYSLIFFILALIALCTYTTSGSAFGIVSERLVRRIRDKSLRTILSQDLDWFQRPGRSTHALISMLNMDAGHLSGLSGVILGTICSVTTSMVGGIVLAHVVAWKIAIVLLAAVPVMIVSGFLRLRILSQFEQRHETAYLEAAALASEACAAIRTVAALGRERDVSRLYAKAVDKPYRESLRFIMYGNFWLAFALAITYFVYALGYYWGSRQVREGNYSTKEFFIVLPALLFSAQGSGQMFSLAPEVTRAKTAAASIFDLHDQRPTIDLDRTNSTTTTSKAVASSEESTPEPSPTCTRATLTHPRGGGKVEFRDVHFCYSARPNPALSGLSLTVKPGTFVAFVGASGAGKSSAISLIERFYDVTAGAVLIDDQDIRALPVRDHRSRISLVSQEPCLFPGSLTFNISLGAAPGVTAAQEDVERVCRMVGLHDFISSLPEGYTTDVGTNGSQLSGGQKQRVALARALIRDPEVLLLDEATSALDSKSEKLVQESVATASRGRTCIAVAHRLASVQKADCIYVFEDGKVVESGRHEELIAAGGRYARMCVQQTLA